jgi:hypothetical protein
VVIIMAALLILAIFVAMGISVLAGWTPDTRDPRFGLWPLSVRPDTSGLEANVAASDRPRWP